MNPFLIVAAGVALLAFLKSKRDSAAGAGGVNGGGPPLPNTTQNSDQSYLARDAGAIVGGVVTVTGAIAAATGTTVGGVLSSAGTAVTSTVAAGGIAFIPLYVVVAFVVAGIIGSRTATAKNFVNAMSSFLPNARHMSFYEASRIEDMCALNNIQLGKTTVQDPRLEMSIPAERIYLIGERTVYSRAMASVAPSLDRFRQAYSQPTYDVQNENFILIQKACRAIALVYTFECAKYASAMLRNWAPKIAFPEGFKLAAPDYWLNHMYDDLAGYEGEKLGGLNQVPLVGGYTEKARVDPAQMHPDASQLRGVNTDALTGRGVESWFPEARFAAFRQVITTIQFDNALYFPFDPIRYAKDVYNRLELDPRFFVLSGSNLILPGSAWGFMNDSKQLVNIQVNIVDIKDNGPLANWNYVLAA